jgi:hypothetical protein
MAQGISPNPQYPERAPQVYEEKIGQNVTRRGPLRFEEGIATDTDVPNDFTKGVMQGYQTAPGRPNHNLNVYEKYAEETLAQRAHMGSAAWVEAPTFLGEFAHGTNNDFAAQKYEQVDRSGGRYDRLNPANVPD